MAEPATGRLISLPERGRPPLNDVYLRRGRWVDPARPDEVLASEMFCEAHGFNPGDRVAAIINGRQRWLTIVGVALSPEYVYAIRPGEMFPDKRPFGIFWMGRRALASAFNMEGGFNDVSLALGRGASAPDVIAGLDRLIEPYGGRGALPQSLQLSAWTLENELTQLQTFGFIMPLIFFGVAAFILNVALARALALQRPQIAALKALGYSNRELAWHYIKWGLVDRRARRRRRRRGRRVARLGADRPLQPVLPLSRRSTTSCRSASRWRRSSAASSSPRSARSRRSGAPSAFRRPKRCGPEPPARYRRSLLERPWRRFRPDAGDADDPAEPGAPAGPHARVGRRHRVRRRRAVRRPRVHRRHGRADQPAVQRGDAAGCDGEFVEPRSGRAVHDVEHLPGVMDLEPMRSVPVRLRAGHRSRTLAITGLPRTPRLNRVVDRDGRALSLPADGLVLSKMLGDILGVAPGESLQVEVLEGERPVRDVPVAALVDDSHGAAGLHAASTPCARCCAKAATITGAARHARSGGGRSLLRDGQDAAGGGRRGAARGDAAELPRDDGRRT